MYIHNNLRKLYQDIVGHYFLNRYKLQSAWWSNRQCSMQQGNMTSWTSHSKRVQGTADPIPSLRVVEATHFHKTMYMALFSCYQYDMADNLKKYSNLIKENLTHTEHTSTLFVLYFRAQGRRDCPDPKDDPSFPGVLSIPRHLLHAYKHTPQWYCFCIPYPGTAKVSVPAALLLQWTSVVHSCTSVDHCLVGQQLLPLCETAAFISQDCEYEGIPNYKAKNTTLDPFHHHHSPKKKPQTQTFILYSDIFVQSQSGQKLHFYLGKFQWVM